MSTYKRRRPAGFRAVRVRGKTEIVYCVERPKKGYGSVERGAVVVDVYADGSKTTITSKDFSAQFVVEHAPMPPAVKELFEGKLSFAQWWDERQPT